jgi:hypothetical protein
VWSESVGAVPAVPSPLELGWWVSEAPALWVVGVDPGGGSGWAVLRVDAGAVGTVGVTELARGGGVQWRAGEVRGPEPYQAEALLAVLRGVWAAGEWESGGESDQCVVTVERFVLRLLSMDADLLSPVRITAMMEALSWRGLPFPVVQFQAVDAMKVVTDERLRRWGFWHPSEHARDALRHALLVLRKMSSEEEFRVGVLGRMSWLLAADDVESKSRSLA